MARKHHKKNKNKKVLNGIDLINQSNNLSKKNNNDNINANINTDISKINNNHKNDNTDDNIKNTSENIPHEVFKIYVAGRPCSIVKGFKHKVTEKNRNNKKSVTVITKKTYKIK